MVLAAYQRITKIEISVPFPWDLIRGKKKDFPFCRDLCETECHIDRWFVSRIVKLVDRDSRDRSRARRAGSWVCLSLACMYGRLWERYLWQKYGFPMRAVVGCSHLVSHAIPYGLSSIFPTHRGRLARVGRRVSRWSYSRHERRHRQFNARGNRSRLVGSLSESL